MKYKKLALSKFNLISCQFSLHYYFKDEFILNKYLQNISDNCSKGGYFIGTCFDGQRLFDDLKNTSKLEYYDEYKNKIYSIEKKYELDNFDYDSENTNNMLGNKIEVFMDSIGYTIPEYLVNFDYFINMMKQYGFELIKNFGLLSPPNVNVIDKPIGKFGDIIDKLNDLYTRDTDLTDTVMDLLQNDQLIKLSSYNNYFVFYKK